VRIFKEPDLVLHRKVEVHVQSFISHSG
jgi:hypothetical protein